MGNQIWDLLSSPQRVHDLQRWLHHRFSRGRLLCLRITHNTLAIAGVVSTSKSTAIWSLQCQWEISHSAATTLFTPEFFDSFRKVTACLSSFQALLITNAVGFVLTLEPSWWRQPSSLSLSPLHERDYHEVKDVCLLALQGSRHS